MNNEKKFSKHPSPTGALKACVEALSSAQTALLIRLDHMQTLATDKLPYTPEFRKLVKTFQDEYGKNYKERMLFDALIGLRKNKKLVKKNKKLVKKVAKTVTVSACINCGSLNGKEALWRLTRLASEYVCDNCT